VIKVPPHMNLSSVDLRKVVQRLELYFAILPLITRFDVFGSDRVPQDGSRNWLKPGSGKTNKRSITVRALFSITEIFIAQVSDDQSGISVLKRRQCGLSMFDWVCGSRKCFCGKFLSKHHSWLWENPDAIYFSIENAICWLLM